MKNNTTYINAFENETQEYLVTKPLEHKGLNKHFFNLISAEVFTPKKTKLSFLKRFFNF